MAIQAADLPDLVSSTLRDLGRLKYTDLSSSVRKHVAMKRLMRKSHMKVFDSGYEFQWNVVTGHNSSARATGLFYTANPNYKDVVVQGSAPFRHYHTDWGIDRRMIQMNSAGPQRILDIVQLQRKIAAISLIELMETKIWQAPSTTNDEDVYGIYYWIVKNASTGFNGGAPGSHSSVGGISPTTYARWKNYTAQYTHATAEDLVALVDTALTQVEFVTPVEMPTYDSGDGMELFCNLTTRNALKTVAKSQNDQLGFDLDPVNGRLAFRRLPLQEVPILAGDGDNPVIGIDWGEMRLAVLANEWMREVSFTALPHQPTTSAVYTDSSFNLFTTNRRRHFIVAQGTSGTV